MFVNSVNQAYSFLSEIGESNPYIPAFTAIAAIVGITALRVFCASRLERRIPSQTLENRAANEIDLEQQWDRLEKQTQANFTIPLLQSYPHQRHSYPRCRWVEKNNSSSWDLSAHWIGSGITDRKIIALQVPRPYEFRENWGMLRQRKYLIIDLTTAIDQLRLKQETPISFYPTAEAPLILKPLEVTYKGMKNGRHLYQVRNKRRISSQVQRLHYDKWTDGSAVSLPELDRLVDICLSHPDGVVIHCLGGLGRTGTLITASILKERIQKGQITRENFNAQRLVDLVYDLRLQRSQMFVQKYQQFELLYQYALTNIESFLSGKKKAPLK